MTLDFGANLIAGGGAQIQADFFGPFIARITSLDSMGAVINSFTENGNSTSNGDNGAIYIGVQDANADIRSIQFSLDAAQNAPNDFAINQFSFNGAAAGRVVPEPASLTLLGLGALCLVGYGRKRWKTA